MRALKASVVIPTLNAGSEIKRLLLSLRAQTLEPSEVLVVDSSSDDDTVEQAGRVEGVRVMTIPRCEFNHGGTRHLAFLQTSGDIVCFLTQDAIPVDESYLANLVRPIVSNERVALSSGRQLPKPDARRFEQLVRGFNYPAISHVRGIEDLRRFGIKTFFASDVCSAYLREAYLSCGGFPALETNEDMYMAARLIREGWLVAYAADAEVLHSHNLTPRQQYERNRAVGRFMEQNEQLLSCSSEIGEGGRLVKDVSSTLLKEGSILELLAFAVDCAARFAGNRAGRRQIRKANR